MLSSWVAGAKRSGAPVFSDWGFADQKLRFRARQPPATPVSPCTKVRFRDSVAYPYHCSERERVRSTDSPPLRRALSPNSILGYNPATYLRLH